MAHPQFSPAEIKLLDAVNAGQTADYRLPLTSGDFPNQAKDWSAERTISASVIRSIVTQAIPAVRPTPAGVGIAGARIAGELQLASLNVPFPLELTECHIEQPMNLCGAKIDSLNLTGSHIGRLNADSLELSSSVSLSNGFLAKDEVSLRRAIIGGDLSCIGGSFCQHHPQYLALNAEGAIIHGHGC